MKDKFQVVRHGDYVFDCNICGQRCWFSQHHILAPETGRGGCVVCPECNDPWDYGIIPYYVRAEQPVQVSRDANHTANPKAIPNDGIFVNYDKFDPTIYTPQQLNALYQPWNLQTVAWNNWSLQINAWGS